jgi:hypothetical protein
MTGECLGAFDAFERRAAQPQAEPELVEAQERHAAVPTLCTLARLGQDEREQPHPVRAQFCQNARTEVRQRLPAAVVARPADHEPGPIRVEAALWTPLERVRMDVSPLRFSQPSLRQTLRAGLGKPSRRAERFDACSPTGSGLLDHTEGVDKGAPKGCGREASPLGPYRPFLYLLLISALYLFYL